jgi:hypothetical protein
MAKELVQNVLYSRPDGSRGVVRPGEDLPDHFTKEQKDRLERIGALIDTSDSDYNSATAKELAEEAANRGLDVPEKAKKADLVALLEADDAGTAPPAE